MTSILGQSDANSRTKNKEEAARISFLLLQKAAIVTGGNKTGLQGKKESVKRLQFSMMGVARLEGYNESSPLPPGGKEEGGGGAGGRWVNSGPRHLRTLIMSSFELQHSGG